MAEIEDGVEEQSAGQPEDQDQFLPEPEDAPVDVEDQAPPVPSAEDQAPQASSAEDAPLADTAPVAQFKLDEKDRAPEATPPGELENDTEWEIVHRGQVHRIKQDKLVALAQKGFDYDVKVGPHTRIAQLIDADPDIARVVNEHIQAKVYGPKPSSRDQATPRQGEGALPFKVRPISDYEDEVEWLTDHIKRDRESRPRQVVPVAPQNQPPQVSPATQMLMSHDPEHFNVIAPHLSGYSRKLSVEDWQAVDQDPVNLLKFYDFVKGHVLARTQTPGVNNGSSQVRSPGFRVQPGGSDAPNKNDVQNPWKIPNDKFQAILDRVKMRER